jgi:hypothetical protein
MAKLSKDLVVGTLHPRENLFTSGTIGALNAEVVVACDGSGSVSLDMRGTAVLSVEVSGTVDGTNWTLIPVRPVNLAAVAYLTPIVYPAGGGVWVGSCAGFRQVRARCTAYTSGSVVAFLNASTVLLDQSVLGQVTTGIITATSTIGLIVTATIPNPGPGLRNYVTFVSIDRFAGALLVAAATPVLVTTTNFPVGLTFSAPAEAALQGTISSIRQEFPYPVASAAQNSTTTIVGPATTNVIWRITAGYYVAP